MKKYLKILSAILLVGAIGGGIYWFFQKTPAGQNFIGSVFPGTSKNGGLGNNSADSAKEKFQIISAEPIFDYWINSKTGSIYYLNEAGQVLKKSDGSEELVNSQTLPKLNRLSASSDGGFAIAKFNYPDAITFSIFNTVTNSWQPLPAGTIAAAWSPTNSQELIYLDDKALKILNLVSQKTAEVMKLTQKEANLDWVNDSTVFLSVPAATEIVSTLWTIDISKKTLLPLFKEQFGLTANWSKNSDLGIKLYNLKGKPFLDLVDKKGTILDTFNFKTLPEKCSFNKSKLYCAVPKNISEAVRLPDDYYKKAVYFEDAIYLIDLSGAGVSELTANLPITIDAEHLEISGGKLFFKNRLDDKLYSLRIE